MRCPKCGYISFGAATRCRNCGYDFSLSEDVEPIDLPIQSGSEPIGPFGDLPLTTPSAAVPERQLRVSAEVREPVVAGPTVPPRLDLPLFASDDAPLVAPPAVPRPPLSVRRSAPISRPRSEPTDDLQLEGGAEPARAGVRRRRELERADVPAESGPTLVPAGALPRILGGLIDALIVGSIDFTVLYLTLRLCGLQFDDILLLPKIPLVAFLLLLNGGYFVLFTAAGGQTIGKMMAGLRVVMDSEEGPRRVAFGAAVVRSVAYLASLLPAGLGFTPILFSPDRRTLHDRLSNTRVVKA